MRVLIGGVGYHNLRDYSVGGAVVDRLAAVFSTPRASDAGPGTQASGLTCSNDVVVEDLSYNPIALVQRLGDEASDRQFRRSIFVGSVARGGGRKPGTITAYRWDGALPSSDLIQTAVTEGITGVISLDNTLMIARYFGALPDEVIVVEVEPAVHEFGDTFSPAVAEVFERVCTLVTALATDERAVARVPEAPLGGGMWLSADSGFGIGDSQLGRTLAD